MKTSGAVEPRSACGVCARPTGFCYCESVTPLRTRTRVVVLQHPREARVPLGTVHILRLALPDATVRRGIEFADDPEVAALCAERPAPCVLYPGPEARELSTLTEAGPITLIAIDGTWAQARAILRRNPALAALPRVRLAAGAPSAYRIRRQPAAHCVSTLEALARALDVLEGPPRRFEQALLRPLHTLVADQLRCSEALRSYRTSRPRRRAPRPPAPDSAARLAACWERLVCVQGEANDWPAGAADRPPPELIQWRARRPADGRGFSAVIRPRRPLGPCTLDYTELAPSALSGAPTWDAFDAGWRAFTRPDDVLAVWGHFYAGLAAQEGLPLPAERIDVRVAASRALGRRPGSIERCAEALGVAPPEATERAADRCTRRSALLAAIVTRLVAPGSP